PALVLRFDAPAARPREARPAPPPAAAAAAVRRVDHPPVLGRPAARLHVRPRTAEQDLDDDGGVRSLAVHGGRIHHCGRAAAAAGPPCDVPDRLPPLARSRLRPLVQLSLFRGRIDELGPAGSTSYLAVSDRFRIFQQPFPSLL